MSEQKDRLPTKLLYEKTPEGANVECRGTTSEITKGLVLSSEERIDWAAIRKELKKDGLL